MDVLDRTLDFIAYVSLFGDTDENKAVLMRCTVPDVLFRHIFGG